MQSGATLYQQGQLAEARKSFTAALTLQPDLSPAKFNIAIICRDLGEDDEAESLFRQLLDVGEIVADSKNNLGILAARRHSPDEALSLFRDAIRCRDDFPLAHFNLATMLLRLEQWEEGWREYEWRWRTPSFTPVQCPQPQWNGERLDGTLLLHTEQGIGDVFQFCRFIPMIRERCRRVVFLRPAPLDCMFPEERHHAEPWADEVRSPGQFSLDSFDAILPLMSAPFALRLSPADLPLGENYLTPVERTVELPPPLPDTALRVGITWRGSPTHSNDAFRSIDVNAFLPLLRIPRVAFYSLQVGEAADELARLGEHRGGVCDLRHHQQDFADTAAIVKQLDLVITVDTSMLHLCGGLGLPVWGLISKRCDWRWLDGDRTDSPWYPTVRLFRQQTLNDWPEVMRLVARELETLTEKAM